MINVIHVLEGNITCQLLLILRVGEVIQQNRTEGRDAVSVINGSCRATVELLITQKPFESCIYHPKISELTGHYCLFLGNDRHIRHIYPVYGSHVCKDKT